MVGQVCNGLTNSLLVACVGAVGKQFISQGAVVTLTLLGVLSKRDHFALTATFVFGCVLQFSGLWVWKFGVGLTQGAKGKAD